MSTAATSATRLMCPVGSMRNTSSVVATYASPAGALGFARPGSFDEAVVAGACAGFELHEMHAARAKPIGDKRAARRMLRIIARSGALSTCYDPGLARS